MRHRAVIAGGLAALILATLPGCALLRRRDRDDGGPAQAIRRQELSEAAQEAVDRRDLPAARGLLAEWLAEQDRSAEAHMRLGQVLQLQGALDLAAAEYRRALEIDNDYADALIGLGQILHQLGHDSVALERFAQAIEIDPNRPEAHFAEGLTLEAMGRPTDALASYFRALERDPTSAETIVRVAALQLARHQPDQALARLDQALQVAPEHAEARHFRGLAHLALGHADEAVADLKAASAKLPDRPDVFFHLAQALDAAKQKAEALAAAEQALRLNPGYADAR
jgi:tetratricopeptide (TPR) repeat protein